MSENERLRLRPGCHEDRVALRDLLEAFDMQAEIPPEKCLIAECSQKIMGFARLEFVDEMPYLRPIIVALQYQCQGVGRRLVQTLLSQVHELRVVARGNAVEFYTCMGFKPVDWGSIPAAFRRECELCPDITNCQPVPMACLEEMTTTEQD